MSETSDLNFDYIECNAVEINPSLVNMMTAECLWGDMNKLSQGDADPAAFSQVSVLRRDERAVHEPPRRTMQAAQVLRWLVRVD